MDHSEDLSTWVLHNPQRFPRDPKFSGIALGATRPHRSVHAPSCSRLSRLSCPAPSYSRKSADLGVHRGSTLPARHSANTPPPAHAKCCAMSSLWGCAFGLWVCVWAIYPGLGRSKANTNRTRCSGWQKAFRSAPRCPGWWGGTCGRVGGSTRVGSLAGGPGYEGHQLRTR